MVSLEEVLERAIRRRGPPRASVQAMVVFFFTRVQNLNENVKKEFKKAYEGLSLSDQTFLHNIEGSQPNLTLPDAGNENRSYLNLAKSIQNLNGTIGDQSQLSSGVRTFLLAVGLLGTAIATFSVAPVLGAVGAAAGAAAVAGAGAAETLLRFQEAGTYFDTSFHQALETMTKDKEILGNRAVFLLKLLGEKFKEDLANEKKEEKKEDGLDETTSKAYKEYQKNPSKPKSIEDIQRMLR